MKTYVIFGPDYTHSFNGQEFDKDCIAVIESDTAIEGMELTFKYFKEEYFLVYPESLFNHNSIKYFSRGFIKVKDNGDLVEDFFENDTDTCWKCNYYYYESDVNFSGCKVIDSGEFKKCPGVF